MGRATLVLGLTSSAVAVALIALVYGIGSPRSPSPVEPRRGEAIQAQQTSSVDTELNKSTVVVPLRSIDDYQNLTVTEAPSDTNLVDEDTSRKMLREKATRDVQRAYSLILERLDLTQREKDALVTLLIQDQIARTTTLYSRGNANTEPERSNGIAAIIDDSKLQQFLALERNVREYSEVYKIQSMLQLNDVPLSSTQRDGLLKILVGTRSNVKTTRPADVKSGYIESLEHQLTQINEYNRLVLELAPSVLSTKQFLYLFEQQQYKSEQETYAIERQRKAIAADTSGNNPLWYPIED